MKCNPIEEEKKSWNPSNKKPLPLRHHFAHSCIRSRLYDALRTLCNYKHLILDLGCNYGEDAIYIQRASENIICIDIAIVALRRFVSKDFQGVLANCIKLPLHSNSFDYVIFSDLLNHLIGQGDLKEYLEEFVRVTKEEGYLIALEPKLFHISGILRNYFNTIKPGITGLVPYERTQSPLHLTKVFKEIGLEDVNCISASYIWIRFPLPVSRFISKYLDNIRFKKLFNLFGWFIIIYCQKTSVKGGC